jgi:photosystem II stability/assembly factor-like uncharacterized protein
LTHIRQIFYSEKPAVPPSVAFFAQKVSVTFSSKIAKFFVFIIMLLCFVLPCQSLAAPAELVPLADQSLLLDGQVLSEKVVVVGERGHILVSDDSGQTWQQRPVPTRTTLTSIFFIDEHRGWAAGHGAVILRTTDGGENWTQVYADIDGERPILDLWFRDELNGYAVGAYGLFLLTTDGGDTWQEQVFSAVQSQASNAGQESDDIPGFEEGMAPGEDLHLNQLRESAAGRLYIAAEAGHVFRSDDGGQTWLAMAPPYEGSFFGILPLGNEALLTYGLRGNLLFSPDAGETWTFEETGTSATLNDAIILQDGRIVVVGMGGTLLVSRDEGRTFSAHLQQDRAGLVRVLETRDGHLILIGTHGVRRLTLAAPSPLPRVHREERS